MQMDSIDTLHSPSMRTICAGPVRSAVGRASQCFGFDTRHHRPSALPKPELPWAEREPKLAGSFRAQLERLPPMRISGTLKFYNSAKGFGFITPEDGSKDVFVHASALEKAGIQTLNEGDKITFILEDDRKGRGKQAGQIEKA
jgi:CspA family cold shock protein